MADRVGQQLGNYRLKQFLGEGGFAEVYLADHIFLKTEAAIKMLQMRLSSEEQARFLVEAQTIAHLKHPNIVRVFDYGVAEGSPFLVMDYAPRGTLRQRYPKGTRLPPTVILPYLQQAAAALQYAHNRKLIHRDVKPENLLLGNEDEVLLSDFGIAVIAQSSRYRNPLDVAGTVAYMAPEQLLGKPVQASDQYALGIVVYEWLSGERPFHGSYREIASQHAIASPPALRQRVPALSTAVEEVVLTALAKDPDDRYASMQMFAQAFEQAIQAKPSLLFAPTQSRQPASSFDTPTLAVPPPVSDASRTILTPPGQRNGWAEFAPTVIPSATKQDILAQSDAERMQPERAASSPALRASATRSQVSTRTRIPGVQDQGRAFSGSSTGGGKGKANHRGTPVRLLLARILTVLLVLVVVATVGTAIYLARAPSTTSLLGTRQTTSASASTLPAGTVIAGSEPAASRTAGPTATPRPGATATSKPGATTTPPAGPAGGTWTTTGGMISPRESHSATLLQNGKVLVAGGRYAGAVVSGTELYDPTTGTWSSTGNLNTPRWNGAGLVTLANGKALIFAGADINNNDFASAELYDPATGAWSYTGSLNTPRRAVAVVLLQDGRVLAIAGRHGPPDGTSFLASSEIYNPATGLWSYTGSVAVARDGADAVVLLDGRVLLAGGEGHWYVSGNTGEIYNPASGAWSSAGTMPWGWSGASMTVLSDGRVLVAGGDNTNGTIFANAALYNPTTNTWTSTGSMNVARVGHSATLLADGRVLVAGGFGASGILQSSEFYNPSAGIWSLEPNLQAPMGGQVTVTLPNGNILAIGGRDANGVTASCEVFIKPGS